MIILKKYSIFIFILLLSLLKSSNAFADFGGGDWNSILVQVSANDPSGGLSDFNSITNVLLNVVFGSVLTISLIMFIVTGIKFISSRGNPKLLEEARRSLTWTIVSMFLTVLSYTLRTIILDTVY